MTRIQECVAEQSAELSRISNGRLHNVLKSGEASTLEPARPNVAESPYCIEIDGWCGQYHAYSETRSGDGYSYWIDVLNWNSLPGAIVRVAGWQHDDEELLCSVQERDREHLELLFEQHGPKDKARHPYPPGAVLLTLGRRMPYVKEWGTLQPIGLVMPAEPPTEIPQGKGWDSAYPSDFMRVPSVIGRLSKLMGPQYEDFKSSLGIQSPVQREGALVLMTGSMGRSSPVRGSLVYDLARDVIHASICDPECKERIDVWSEDWHAMNPRIRTWIKTCTKRPLPLKEHRGR